MSMCLYLKSGGPAELSRLATDPDRLMASMGGATAPFAGLGGGKALDPEAVARLRRQVDIDARKSGLIGGFIMKMMTGRMLKQLEKGLKAANDDGEAGEPAEGDTLDLHKSWHVLHYLFTGTAWEGKSPADSLLNGGKEVGDDLGYGAARLLDAKTTAEFANFLRTQTVESLLAKIDMRRMSALEIYCAEDGDDAGREDIEVDVEEYFPMLKEFVTAAAEKGDGLLVWMA